MSQIYRKYTERYIVLYTNQHITIHNELSLSQYMNII